MLAAEESELKQFDLLNFFDSFTLDGINFEQFKLDTGLASDLDFTDYYRDQYNAANKASIKKLYILLKNDWGWIH